MFVFVFVFVSKVPSRNCQQQQIQNFQKGQSVGQIMFPHHSDQMSHRSQVSRVALCMSKSKGGSVSESVSQSVSQSVTRSPIELSDYRLDS